MLQIVARADRVTVTVYGVDLYPPPQGWVPPNCILEVEDVTKPWTWSMKFDLINMRMLMGGFSVQEWKTVYRQAYEYAFLSPFPAFLLS